MSAAKWHREEAAILTTRIDWNRKIHSAAASLEVERLTPQAAHHATAADALEALAVPGVAELIETLSKSGTVHRADGKGNYRSAIVDKQQRAALATLAKIASEGK